MDKVVKIVSLACAATLAINSSGVTMCGDVEYSNGQSPSITVTMEVDSVFKVKMPLSVRLWYLDSDYNQSYASAAASSSVANGQYGVTKGNYFGRYLTSVKGVIPDGKTVTVQVLGDSASNGEVTLNLNNTVSPSQSIYAHVIHNVEARASENTALVSKAVFAPNADVENCVHKMGGSSTSSADWGTPVTGIIYVPPVEISDQPVGTYTGNLTFVISVS